jgi:hypothetical protein
VVWDVPAPNPLLPREYNDTVRQTAAILRRNYRRGNIPRPCAGSNQAVFRCDYGGLDARGDVEPRQDMLQMDLDRGFGDAELAADILLAGVAGDAARDCKFNLPGASS